MTDANERGNSWSPREVVAHLSLAERTDWITHLLEYGESRPFPTFNREGERTACKSISMAELLNEFAAERAASLDKLQRWR